jgi:hypothetical protein
MQPGADPCLRFILSQSEINLFGVYHCDARSAIEECAR